MKSSHYDKKVITMKEQRMIVVLAHPDDESFPLGGTLAKYATEGAEVTLVCATKGEAGIPGLPAEETAHLRERELRAAADILGLSDVRFLGWQDGELEKGDANTVIQQLIAILTEIQPQVVITFGADGISGHPDHIAIHRLTTAAFKQAQMDSFLYYIVPSEATQQGCGVILSHEITGGPTVGINVSHHLVTKVRAAQCHASQNPPFPGDPEKQAENLACHEYFVLALPVLETVNTQDLFDQKFLKEVHHERA
jgi:LmbE family N-acetylglucosaminyl deacetylase